MPIADRFSGATRRPNLIRAIKQQRIVGNNESLAEAIALVVRLEEYQSNTIIITQGAHDNDIFLVIVGSVSIVVNGHPVASRKAGNHVGEMALIDPTAPRAATVVTTERTLVARISEPEFSRVADKFSTLWRELAMELCVRLRQRNDLIPHKNAQPSLFIGSSSEALPVALQIEDSLRTQNQTVTLWAKGVFEASHAAIEDLESEVKTADFAAMVLAPDDKAIIRGERHEIPRDNVIFELGLFMGALTRERVLMVVPAASNLKLPSDLLGLTQLRYQTTSKRIMTPRHLGELVAKIKERILRLGPK